MIRYIVTTDSTALELLTEPICILDGSVKGADAAYHFDHHRLGGADIQLDEISDDDIRMISKLKDVAFVTPQLDMDAICTTVALRLGDELTDEAKQMLRAISYDCDHLYVPKSLAQYGETAIAANISFLGQWEQITAAFGAANSFNPVKAEWTLRERQTADSFTYWFMVGHFILAARGLVDWVVASESVQSYLRQVEEDTKTLCKQEDINVLYNGEQEIGVYVDCLWAQHYVDPRAVYKAISLTHQDLQTPIVLVARRHPDRGQGVQYTLGSIPLHTRQSKLNYCTGVYEALSEVDSGVWGGRAIVGGSDRVSPSLLTPREILAIVNDVKPFQDY